MNLHTAEESLDHDNHVRLYSMQVEEFERVLAYHTSAIRSVYDRIFA